MSVIIAPSSWPPTSPAWQEAKPWRPRDWLALDVMDGISCQHHHRPDW